MNMFALISFRWLHHVDEIIAYPMYIIKYIELYLFSIFRSEFIYNPLAEFLPLLVPVPNVLSLDAVTAFATVNVANPLFIGLVLEICPPKTVLGQGALFFMLTLQYTT